MVKLVLFSGSLRRASMNSAMIRAAARHAGKHPAVGAATILSLREFPLFDEDCEGPGEPAVIAAAKRAVHAADGLLIATPEYNGAMSGVVKNAVDWLSRPWGSSPLTGKPVVTMSAAPGPRGGRNGQETLRDSLDELGARVIPHDLLAIPGTGLLDDQGEVADHETLRKIGLLVSILVATCTDQQELATEYQDLLDEVHVEDTYR